MNRFALIVTLGWFPVLAQISRPAGVAGTVTGFRSDSAGFEVRTDAGASVTVGFDAATVVRRVAPGEKDLAKAESIPMPEVRAGDRVLVTFAPGSAIARRVVVMAAVDIAKRNEADRAEWNRRGISGIVSGRKGGDITLRLRSLQGESTATVSVSEKTLFRRYAPDSVKFSDAKPSRLEEINSGDQLRARGEKTPDGLKVAAEEVVFGSFQTKAGVITEVNGPASEITIKDMASNKPLVVRITPDSQLKSMPGFGGPGGGRPGFGPPDFSQMLERMPAATISQLQPGGTILVSSTRTSNTGRITAIMLLANAGTLIQMASRQGNAQGGFDANRGPGFPGMGSVGAGFEMPTMLP